MSNRNRHLSWISSKHLEIESEQFGNNLTSANEKLKHHGYTLSKVQDYKSEILNDSINDDQVVKAFSSLLALATKQQKCLESSAELLSLENIFATFTNDVTNKSVSLCENLKKSQPVVVSESLSPNSVSVYQNCILSIKNNWIWMNKLIKCSEIHLNHSSEYHQFYHLIEELRQWLPIELEKANGLLNVAEMKRNVQGVTINKLLLEIKTALTIFLIWNSKMHQVLQQSKQLVPIQFRTYKLIQPRLAISLANYQTKEINLQEGEELVVLDNSRTQTWKVKNVKNEEFDVPSVILTIPGPDTEAVEAALKLTLEFLSIWTHVVKKYGKTIIWFLLQVIREWTPTEEIMLKSLPYNEKQEIIKLLDSIEKTFGRYWFTYKPYKTLEDRIEYLKKLLIQSDVSGDTLAGEKGSLLVIQTIQLEELLAKYREFWKNWEMYKVVNETMKHPEYLLTVSSWDEYHYLDLESWLLKWQLALEIEDDEETIEPVEDHIQVQRAKETAKTSQLFTSEQEENQTFIITGVMDTKSGEMISLKEAIERGIINQLEGKYYDTKSGSSVPIPMAMFENKIQGQTETTKSPEKIKDLGLITITIIKETRPYKLKGVLDPNTNQQLSVEEATKAGILDQKNNLYRDMVTGQVVSLTDALNSGLLVVEFQAMNGIDNVEPVTEKITYAVNAVYDSLTNQKFTFSEAIRNELINPDNGSYQDNRQNKEVYIGDAIKEGYVKAIIIKNPQSFDINPANRISIGEEKLEYFKKNLLKPLKALQALKQGANI